MALFECPECGGKVSDKATQCPHCGCPVEQPHKQSKTCPECGQEVDASVMVCPNCAFPLSHTKGNGKDGKHSNTTNTENRNGKLIVDRNESECPLCKSVINESDDRCPVCGITAHLRNLIKRAAEDATAANELGRCYELGDEIMMDYSKALYWYKQAAKKGNVDGMVNLARLYAGWNEDTIKAKHWCDEAVRNGREDAYTQVGNELKKRGQDKKAVCWYNKDLGFEIQKQREQKEARKKRKENRKQSNGRLLKPSIYAIAVSLVCVIVYFFFFNFNDRSLKNCEEYDSYTSTSSTNPSYWVGTWTSDGGQIVDSEGNYRSHKSNNPITFTFNSNTMTVHVNLKGIEYDKEWAIIPDGSGVAFFDINGETVSILAPDGKWYCKDLNTGRVSAAGMILRHIH